MAMGRGSANKVTDTVALGLVFILCFILASEVVESAVYTVGDSAGWGFNSATWSSKSSRFKAGDVLVFNYNPSIHNVVAVNAAGYNSCKTPRGARVFTSGGDRITLARGTNYFICNFSGHCESGMKIAVTAA